MLLTRARTSQFSLQQINQGKVQILSISGYMGIDECCQVETELARLLEQEHRRVILDLASLSFVTVVSFVRLLVCAHEFQRRGGKLKLAGLSASFRRMAEFAGFNQETDFDTDVTVALQSMSQPPDAKPSSRAKRKA
jgi:anti-anti-sigma factor